MEGPPAPVGALDSITLGQLRSMVNSQPKARVRTPTIFTRNNRLFILIASNHIMILGMRTKTQCLMSLRSSIPMWRSLRSQRTGELGKVHSREVKIDLEWNILVCCLQLIQSGSQAHSHIENPTSNSSWKA